MDLNKKYHFLRFPGFKNKAVTLSYDDGTKYDEKLIEIMKRYGLRGTFNISSAFFGNGIYLSKQGAKDLYTQDGIEVAVHGRQHLPLSELPCALAVKEIISDREALEDMFSTIIVGMAYAEGSYNDRVVQILQDCGIEYARVGKASNNFSLPTDWYRMSMTCHHNDPTLNELLDKFLSDPKDLYIWHDNPKLFSLWGHSSEFEINNNWDIFSDFAARLGNREDIWYATNKELFEYVQAFGRLRFSVSGKTIFNPSQIGVYLNWFGKEIYISGGNTIQV